MYRPHYICLADADPPLAQCADANDDDSDADRQMDFAEERDFADQGPLTDMDMEEDAQILGKELSGPSYDMVSYMIS